MGNRWGKPKRRDRAGLQTKIALHTLWRGEAQLALMQAVFHIVNCHISVAVKADQVVAVALVVAKKEVFAVYRAILTPILLGYLDSWRLGMKIESLKLVLDPSPYNSIGLTVIAV